MTHFQFINIYLQIIKTEYTKQTLIYSVLIMKLVFIPYRFAHLYGHLLSSISSGDLIAL